MTGSIDTYERYEESSEMALSYEEFLAKHPVDAAGRAQIDAL